MKISMFFSITVIIISLIIPLIHYIQFDRDRYIQDIQNYTKLSTLSSLSYSVLWFEPRIRRFESSINKETPQLPSQDRLTFVYGDMNVK